MAGTAKDDDSGSGFSSLIADLPGVVRQFWSAVAWPLFELAVTLIALSFVFNLERQIAAWTPDRASIIDSQLPAIMELYGLKAIIPVAVLVALLGLAQANAAILRSIGTLMPVKLASTPKLLLAGNASFDNIVSIWYLHPDIADLDALDTLINVEVKRVDATDPIRSFMANSRRLCDQKENYLSVGNYLKGLLGVILLSECAEFIIFERQPHWDRLILVAAIIIILLAYSASNRIAAERNYAAQKVSEYLYYLQMKGRKATAVDLTGRLDSLKSLRDGSAFGQWRIKLGLGTPGTDMVELLKAWRIIRPPSSSVEQSKPGPG